MNKNTQHIRKKVGKILSGEVVSTKMKNTVVVSVERFVKHQKYDKYIQITNRYKAHDEGNSKKIGDRVDIIECRPMSKDKHFRILEN